MGCSFAIASSETPLPESSRFTFSSPILSSLSMATVISTSRSFSPMISAIPARIFLALPQRVSPPGNTSYYD
jgi:hypothetical protein